MGYKVKIQKIQRAANKTYYVNFPGAFAEAVNLEKGEQMEWFIEGRNCFVLKRVKKAGSFLADAKETSPKRRDVVAGKNAAGAAKNKSR